MGGDVLAERRLRCDKNTLKTYDKGCGQLFLYFTEERIKGNRFKVQHEGLI